MRKANLLRAIIGGACLLLVSRAAHAGKKSVSRTTREKGDRTLATAIEAAQPFVREGFTLREEYWGGSLPAHGQKTVVQQLFKGNEYWFFVSGDTAGAVVSVHVYDENGNLADSEYWKKARAAGVHVTARKTASYYIIAEVESTPQPEARWSMIYGFR